MRVAKKITPLILITYSENAFQYGVNPNVDDCVVESNLDIGDAGSALRTFNKKAQSGGRGASTGIGLKNTGERLKQLHSGKHFLHISENNESYCVTLALEPT